MSVPQEILDFWFEPSEGPDYLESRKKWFVKDDAFDAEVTRRFLGDHQKADQGELDVWAETAEGTLALIILLDQFPRNMFRGEPKAFATDARALELARQAVDKGFDRNLATPHHRLFFYLPFEHSENLADQERCMELTRQIPGATEEGGYFLWAVKHRDIIARFGRFPHRNAILGRPSSEEEIAFLEGPESSF